MVWYTSMKTGKLIFGLIVIASMGISSCTNNEQFSIPSSITEASSVAVTSETPKEVYYHVSFINDDETLLYETDVLKGDTATYVGESPTKEENSEFKYVFIGWDQPLTNINEDLVTKAVYKSIAKENWSPVIWF